MGVIIKDIEVEGDKGKAVLRTLFDTGASHSLIRKDKAEQLATIVPLAHPYRFRLGDGTSELEVRSENSLSPRKLSPKNSTTERPQSPRHSS